MSEKLRIMSGMRPTGKLHLGHYLGVIKNWVNLQNEYDCYFSVADWHALTTKYDKTEELKQNVLDVVIDWLASGINPNISTIFVQSMIPEIAELNIYLGMITPQNWVERDPTLKDMAKILRTKEGQNSQLSYGLLGYPVLMSADIMVMNASVVPVGIDQVAHIEITRDIVRRFNNLYKKDYFNEPTPKLNNCQMLCGLDGQKMGKSFNNDIKLADSEDATLKKVMKAITDTNRIRKDDLGNPDNCLVAYKYWQIFGSEVETEQICEECKLGKRGCADCKRALATKINEALAPIREKRAYFEANLDEVKDIINEGSKKARIITKRVISDVRELINMY